MSLTKKDRSIQPNLGNNHPNDFRGPITSRDFTVAIASALHNDYSGMRSAVKIVARQTGANERAVKNWLDAKNGPSGEHLVALACHSNSVLETFYD